MKNSSERRKPGSGTRVTLYGLALPPSVLKALQKRGIYCTPKNLSRTSVPGQTLCPSSRRIRRRGLRYGQGVCFRRGE